jgi:hypothetical protein
LLDYEKSETNPVHFQTVSGGKTMTTKSNKLSAWDRIMMAITFAEAGDPTTAREIYTTDAREQRPESRSGKKAENRPELRV